MIESILRFSIQNRFLILLLTIAAAGFGIYSLQKLPIDAVPDVTNNQIQINTSVEGLTPLKIEKQVTFTIENALSGIQGLESTRSLSRNGFSQVTAVFKDDVNIYFARQQVSERLNQIRETLPAGADPIMGPISTGLGEVYMWTVEYKPFNPRHNYISGQPGWQPDGDFRTPEGRLLHTEDERLAYLRTVQDWIIRPQLKSIPGIAEIDSIGGYVMQYQIEPLPQKMIALGITLDDLVTAVQENNLSVGAGYIESNGEAFLVNSDASIKTPEQLAEVVVATRKGSPIYLRDIAEVAIGKEMRSGSSSKNGHEIVTGTAMMVIGGNSRTVAHAVDVRLKEVEEALPADIMVHTVMNRTKLIDSTIHTVRDNLAEGALLVVAVLFILLGNLRAALLTAFVIPLAMLLTAIGMIESKISGNLMSLGAIDFGLIVDGAVIIAENCLRRMAARQKELRRKLSPSERLDEVLKSSKEMIQPSVYGQAIIITVYLPILTLSGVEGKMFHPMAMTVIYALIAAFILSITFIPAMIAICLSGKVEEKENILIHGAKIIYSKLLSEVLKFPGLVLTAACLLLAGAYFLFHTLGQEFVPTLDEHDIAVQATRSPSTSLSQATKMQFQVENTLKKFPEVALVFSKTGTAEVASDPMPPDASDTFVMLKPRKDWPDQHLSKLELIESMEEQLHKLVGNNFEFTQPIQMRFNELIAGVQSDIAVKIYGDDFDALQSTANEVSSVLKQLPGAADVVADKIDGLPVLEVAPKRDIISRYGLNLHDVLEVVETAVGGTNAGVIFEGDRRFDIVVRLKEDLRNNLDALGALAVALPADKDGQFHYIPLKEVADLKVVDGLNEISRENGKRLVIVQANVRGLDIGTFVENAKAAIHKQVKIPPGYWIDWGGQFENLLSARERLAVVIPVCFFLILILLYSAFKSFKDAILVFTGVPLALTGGVAALWMRGMPFSISAAVGFIALSGIAVLNGLVMVTHFKQLRGEGHSLLDSIKEGALDRLRPVLMTALVASLGFLPMALATGAGAEVQKPLATVVVGGLISSTLLTLVVLPILYRLFTREERSEEKDTVEQLV